MPIKINGATSGSTTITAPATGGDESIELSTALASKQADVLTTKGDLAAYGTAVARLGVGTNGQVLTADSGETLGVKWDDPSGGLTWIATETFATQSTVSLNGCFTSTYTNYRVMVNITAFSTAIDLYLRLRASGSDVTSSNYYGANLGRSNSANSLVYGSSANGAAQFPIAQGAGSGYHHADLTFFNPQVSGRTTTATGTSFEAGNYVAFMSGFGLALTSSYDGFSLIASTGTISGEVRVYGYQNS